MPKTKNNPIPSAEEKRPIDHFRFSITTKISAFRKLLLGKPYEQLIVCGFPRSGTSLLYNMLSSTLNGFHFEDFEVYSVFRMHQLGNIATKAPLDVFNINHIEKLNIHNKKTIILIAIRDPRDIITSKHPIKSDDYFIGHDHSWWPQNEDFSDWKFDAPGVIEVFDEIEKVKDRPDTMIIRYEDLISSPDATQSVISEKFSLNFSGSFSTYHTSKNKHAYRYDGKRTANDQNLVLEGEKVSSGRVSRWQETKYHDRIIQQFEECPKLFEVMERLGYDSGIEWFQQLSPPRE